MADCVMPIQAGNHDVNSNQYSRLVDLLVGCGLQKDNALALACFANGEELTGLEITIRSGMQQPRVSISTAYLRKNRWLKFKRIPIPKGRPYFAFTLTKPFHDIVREIADARMEDLKRQHNDVCELLDMTSEA